jgi:ADP-ribose pyrophosphatase
MNTPEILSREEIYRGEQIDLLIDTIREELRAHRREIVIHPGSAAVVACFDDETIALVRQYRHPTSKYLVEIPAGSLEPSELPEETATRELKEEVGLVARRIEKLSEFFVSPGFLQEKMWVYLATEVSECPREPEDDELIEVIRLPFSRALEMIASGEIEDAKTIIGLMLAAPRLGLSAFAPDYPAV